MNQNVVTIIVVTTSAVLNYLLTQPAGTFSSQTLLIIGAISIALTAISRFLPAQGATQKVEITTPVEVTPATPDGGE